MVTDSSATAGQEWVLCVAAVAEKSPSPVVEQISAALVAAGAWILSVGSVSKQCSEMDVEFPRSRCVDVYEQLLSMDVEMTRESHAQIAELWQCTHQLAPRCQDVAARLHLCLFAKQGSEAFLGDRLRPLPQAA